MIDHVAKLRRESQERRGVHDRSGFDRRARRHGVIKTVNDDRCSAKYEGLGERAKFVSVFFWVVVSCCDEFGGS